MEVFLDELNGVFLNELKGIFIDDLKEVKTDIFYINCRKVSIKWLR